MSDNSVKREARIAGKEKESMKIEWNKKWKKELTAFRILKI
jgi:hypothetical protein